MSASGMNYAPRGKPAPACERGELAFAAVGLDHGHIYGMCNGMTEAGAQLKWVYDQDPGKVAAFAERFPDVTVAESEDQVLADEDIQLVASAKVPADHAAWGTRVMRHGKDYFTDKPALTTLAQLAEARNAVAETGRKYAVYYSERVHVESAVFAGQLVHEGAIGRVVQVLGMGPHRPNLASRPSWFFDRERYGGILCDIGSHQAEQFLYYTGNTEARVVSSRVANFGHKDHAGLEDFGDCTLAGANGAAGYFRVDWFTPDGLSAWGDGRLFILGTGVTWSCASTWTYPGRPEATTYTWSTAMGSTTWPLKARSATRSSPTWCGTAWSAPNGPCPRPTPSRRRNCASRPRSRPSACRSAPGPVVARPALS